MLTHYAVCIPIYSFISSVHSRIIFIYLIWNRTQSTVKAKKEKTCEQSYVHTPIRACEQHHHHQQQQHANSHWGARAERKIRYKQNMLLQHNQFQSSKCMTIQLRVVKQCFCTY